MSAAYSMPPPLKISSDLGELQLSSIGVPRGAIAPVVHTILATPLFDRPFMMLIGRRENYISRA